MHSDDEQVRRHRRELEGVVFVSLEKSAGFKFSASNFLLQVYCVLVLFLVRFCTTGWNLSLLFHFLVLPGMESWDFIVDAVKYEVQVSTLGSFPPCV